MKKFTLSLFAFMFCCGVFAQTVNITFEVNTENIAGSVDPNGIFVAGGAEFGFPGDNPLSDPDGDGIYTTTIVKPVGTASHFAFLNGNCPDWSCKENLGGLPCADPSNWNDRWLPPVMNDTTILACFGNCRADGLCAIDSVDITFEVNTATIGMIDPNGIYLAGGSSFGWPGDNQMVDPDGDGIYTITLSRAAGVTSNFTFLNGACPDWSCKENLAGLPCSDPANFNDRTLPPVFSDTTILACFGTCDSDGSCTLVTDSVTITFMCNTAAMASVDPAGIFIAAGGNFGAPGDNPMDDSDGDGVYTFTVTKAKGFTSHYAFANGACPDWSCKENLSGLPCGDPSSFNDRWLPAVNSDTTVMACFGTCDSDGSCTIVSDSIQITFECNTAAMGSIDPAGIFIAGGGNFGSPGDNPMDDSDGDGVYTFTVTKAKGFASYYTFANGACPDWSCKENLAGLPCGDPNNFNDRWLPAVNSDTTVSACFGTCDLDGSCTVELDSVSITFEVNTSSLENVDAEGIFLAGGGNFGSPGDNPMDDSDGDGIYSITVTKAKGFASYFAFANGNCPDWTCKEDLTDLPCADPNNFNDRWLPAVASDTTIALCYGTCDDAASCPVFTNTQDISSEATFVLQPNPAKDNVLVDFGGQSDLNEKQIILYNALGQIVFSTQMSGNNYTLSLSEFNNGLYFVEVNSNNKKETKKLIISK